MEEEEVIVAFGGKAGAGKTTAAAALWYHTGGGIMAFADSLREEITAANFRLSGKKPTPEVERSLLQAWGAARRAADPDYWITRTAQRIFTTTVEPIIIDDLRYRNEFDWVKSNGGVCVRVICLNRPEVLTEAQAQDLSETDLDAQTDWDKVISVPFGKLELLRAEVAALAEQIGYTGRETSQNG